MAKKKKIDCGWCDALEGKKNPEYEHWMSSKNFLIVFDNRERTFGHLLAISKSPRFTIFDVFEGYDRALYDEFAILLHRAAEKYVEFSGKRVNIAHMPRHTRCPRNKNMHRYVQFVLYTPNESIYS